MSALDKLQNCVVDLRPTTAEQRALSEPITSRVQSAESTPLRRGAVARLANPAKVDEKLMGQLVVLLARLMARDCIENAMFARILNPKVVTLRSSSNPVSGDVPKRFSDEGSLGDACSTGVGEGE